MQQLQLDHLHQLLVGCAPEINGTFACAGGQVLTVRAKDRRVDNAKRLLSTTTHSIAHITQEVGYSDVATFSRLFARQVGETPAKYRRRYVL